MVGMSDALQLCSNAEGVETALQADLLRMEGCREVQGFLYGRPMSATALRDMLVGDRVVA
jgi:EAL domain-containing protein (putative c-di-GMP-specific phosphodiesterase class I)